MPAYTGGHRQFAAIVSAFVGIISLCLLVISIFVYRWDLVWILALWFLFLFSLCHLVFFWRKSTTPREVKLIDYPYLLIGAFSIWLAVANGQKEREIYVREFDEMASPSTVEGLQSLLKSSQDKFCNYSTDYKPENYCEWVFGVSNFFAEPFTFLQLRYKIDDMENAIPSSIIRDQGHMIVFYFTSLNGGKHLLHLVKLIDPLGWFSFFGNWDTEPITIQPIANLTYTAIIRSMQKIEKQAGEPSATPDASQASVTTLGSIALGLGKVVLWPFVLAVAVALRITKVTADVTGWAG
jgi:hypothetical protein